jgi:hypothetical protein
MLTLFSDVKKINVTDWWFYFPLHIKYNPLFVQYIIITSNFQLNLIYNSPVLWPLSVLTATCTGSFLTLQVPNLEYIFHCLRSSKESVINWTTLVYFLTCCVLQRGDYMPKQVALFIYDLTSWSNFQPQQSSRTNKMWITTNRNEEHN